MNINRSAAKKSFWRLSLLQVLFLTGIFALVSAVWMYRLQQPSREQAKLLAIEEAALNAARVADRLNSALYQSALADDPRAIGELLAAGADPNFSRDLAHGVLPESVLNEIIGWGDPDGVRLLVAAGADINAARPRPPLEAVVRCNAPEAVKAEMLRVLFAHGADVKLGYSAMDAAIETHAPQMVAMLSEAGAAYGPREMALAGNTDQLRAALQADPALLERPLDDAYLGIKSLLGIALVRGNEELAGWLLDAGAPLEMHEVHDSSAIHVAAQGGCVGMIGRLKADGCDVNAPDKAGDTPLNDCVMGASPRMIDTLINAGADVNRLGGGDETALHRALWSYARKKHANAATDNALEVIRLLLHAGADADAVDVAGQSPRDLARGSSLNLRELYAGR